MPVGYQRHGRRHAEGAEDPIPFTNVIPYAALSRTTTRAVTITDSYNVDEFVDWESYAAADSGDTFESMTDGNGVEGVKVLRTGLYGITGTALVRENNGSDYLPPRLRLIVTECLDGTSNFATSSRADSLAGGWTVFNPANTEYTAPTITPIARHVQLGGFSMLYQFDLSSADSYTFRLVSESGASDWEYFPVYFLISRLGSLHP